MKLIETYAANLVYSTKNIRGYVKARGKYRLNGQVTTWPKRLEEGRWYEITPIEGPVAVADYVSRTPVKVRVVKKSREFCQNGRILFDSGLLEIQ